MEEKFNEKKIFSFFLHVACGRMRVFMKDIRKLKMFRFVYWNMHEGVCLDRMRMTKTHTPISDIHTRVVVVRRNVQDVEI